MSLSKFIYPLAVALPILCGCVSVNDTPPAYGVKPQSFAAYAEDVFRRQNNATSRIMAIASEEPPDGDPLFEALLSAEKDMNGACEQLNEYARRQQDGTDSGLLAQSRVGISIKGCDVATQNVEKLLANIDRTNTAAARSNGK